MRAALVLFLVAFAAFARKPRADLPTAGDQHKEKWELFHQLLNCQLFVLGSYGCPSGGLCYSVPGSSSSPPPTQITITMQPTNQDAARLSRRRSPPKIVRYVKHDGSQIALIKNDVSRVDFWLQCRASRHGAFWSHTKGCHGLTALNHRKVTLVGINQIRKMTVSALRLADNAWQTSPFPDTSLGLIAEAIPQ